MSRMEKDLARLAQGAALVVARLAELRPLSTSGDSPTAATNAYTRWANAQNSPFASSLQPDAPRNPLGRDEVSNAAVNSAIMKGLAGASMAREQQEDTAAGVTESSTQIRSAGQDSVEGSLKAAGQLMLDLSREGIARQTQAKVANTAEFAPSAAPSEDATTRHENEVAGGLQTQTASSSATPHAAATPSAPLQEPSVQSSTQPSATLGSQTGEKGSAADAKPVVESHRRDEDAVSAAPKPPAAWSEGKPTRPLGFVKPHRNSSRVPAGQFERVARFAGLGFGMAMGTVGQFVRGGGSGGVKGMVLSERNSDRLTTALCRMRGAALKFGQLLSIQDEHVIPKDSPLRQVIDRVREEAEQMPVEQLRPTLIAALGRDWRSKFAEFDEEPMAAASIGQVHRALAHDGMELAVKIQYPGVADSIDSDIATLGTFVGPFAPRGLFLSTALEELRIAMKMETDYETEARLTDQMRALLERDPELRVPRVRHELSSTRVLATELLPGVPFDQVAGMSQEVRNKVARAMMRLTLRELFEFNLMQTDPNWSNFLYDEKEGTLNLIDFGATMTYTHEECYQYARLVKAAVDKDRETLIEVSQLMGFLTGKESPEYLQAHVAAAFITGEPFAAEEYDFGACRMTERNSEHLATMLHGRLTPPPRFVYTLHRKLSGAFLSCMRLEARIPCRDIFLEHLALIERKHADLAAGAAPEAARQDHATSTGPQVVAGVGA